jgi:ferredoxin-NADP reductase
MDDNGTRGDRTLQLTSRDEAAEGVVALTFSDPGQGPLPAWEPGAHIDLVLDGVVRQYSLCGDPTDRDHLRVAVLRELKSRGGSEYVHERLAVGDTINIRGPRNHFTLAPRSAYLFIAGGIGITPILPMLGRAEANGAEWELLYGGRTRAGMAFVDELLAKYPERVKILPEDEFGLLPIAETIGGLDSDTAVYCCGPGPLLSAVETTCAEVEHFDLHIERFTPKAIEPGASSEEIEVYLDRSGREITVGAEESILAALLREDVDIDYSCTEGTCGTCETAVLEGTPDHRDSVLTPEEQSDNDCMMVCVSRSCSRRLVLDL